MKAEGIFEVKVAPTSAADALAGAAIDSYSLAKQYHGAMNGPAQGLMLSAGNPKAGAAGYVAVERFSGSLDGKMGGFVLLHKATMNAGNPLMTVTIAPGSGTGELAGITGELTITITDGQHHYGLEYALAG